MARMSTSDESAEEWEEKVGTVASSCSSNRDAWMLDSGDSFDVITASRTKEKTAREKQKSIERERLLWTQTRREVSKAELDGDRESVSESRPVAASSRKKPDGGASWLHRALRRAKEQSLSQGRSLESVAAERWGSLDNLMQMIREAEGKLQSYAKSDNRPDSKQGKICEDSDTFCRRLQGSRRPAPLKGKGWRRGERSPPERRRREREGQRERSPNPAEDSQDGRRHKRDVPAEETERRTTLSTSSGKPRQLAATPRDIDRCPSRTDDQRSPNRCSSHGTETVRSSASSAGPGTSCPGREVKSQLVSSRIASKIDGGWVGKDFVRSDQQVEPHSQEGASIGSEGAAGEPVPPQDSKSSRPLTLEERNAISAKLLKAEMLGKTKLIEKLKAQLELGVVSVDPERQESSNPPRNSDVLLMKTNPRTGYTEPVDVSVEGVEMNTRRKRKGQTCEESYAAQDAGTSVRDLVEMERTLSSADQDIEFAKVISQAGATAQQLDSQDEMLADDIYLAKRPPPEKRRKERELKDAIRDHKTRERTMDSCRFCIDSKRLPRHLIVSLGEYSYISAPPTPELVENSLLMVPFGHTPSTRQVDENVFSELKKFMKAITDMWHSEGSDAVFVETATHLSKLPHAQLHCYAVDAAAGELAPMYFQKAIQEAEGEWLNNKRLIKFDFEKGLMRKIPKGMPYFSVQFGTSGGFAHVIENEQTFPGNFGKQVLGGILDLDAIQLREKRSEEFAAQVKRCATLKQAFQPYKFITA